MEKCFGDEFFPIKKYFEQKSSGVSRAFMKVISIRGDCSIIIAATEGKSHVQLNTFMIDIL